MQDAALVQVEVTERNGDKTYGTAYLFKRNHALTALHVVRNYRAIQFNFSNGEKISKSDQFEIVFPCNQDEDTDIAIIQFDPSDNCLLPEVGVALVGAKPKVNDSWHGVGYPKFAENGEARPEEELKGSCYRLPDGKKVIELACDKIAKVDNWGGVSGTPVFLNDNQHLVAVIIQHDTALENTHFKAAPLSTLFNDASFRQHFHDSKKYDALTQATLSFFEETPDLLRVFQEDRPEQVINGLRPGNIEHFFETIENLPQVVYPRVASQFTLQCLPHFFVDQSVIIDESLLVRDIIDLDCVKDVSAECAMAAFAGRAANLACNEGSDYQPYINVGRGSYALAPEMGIGNTELELETLTNQLLSSSAMENIAKSQSKLDKSLQDRLAKFALGRSNVVDFVNRKLEREKARNKYYYYIVSLDDSEDSIAIRQKIAMYKNTYPSLIFINLKKRDDLPIKEGALYEYLPELITE